MSFHTQSLAQKPSPWPSFGHLIVFLYIVGSIFYIFPSGKPQPADMIMVLGIIVLVIRFFIRPDKNINMLYLAAIVFAGFTFMINMVHFSVGKDFQFVLSSLYYGYDILLFILVVDLFRRDGETTSKVIYVAIAAALILEIIYVQFLPGMRSSRFTGSFHNPNQLAYFSLLCASTILALRINKKFTGQDLFLLSCAGYLQMVALSKAGIICFVLVIFSLLFTRALNIRLKIISFFIILIALNFALLESNRFTRVISQFDNLINTVERIQNIGQETDDSLEGRGYDRIVNYPEYIILGAGEGAYYKYTRSGKNKEMHSGMGTLLFSYGVLGVFLFSILMLMVLYRSHPSMWMIFFAIMLYGLTHQHIRFSFFWLFLASAFQAKMMYIPPAAQKLLRQQEEYEHPNIS